MTLRAGLARAGRGHHAGLQARDGRCAGGLQGLGRARTGVPCFPRPLLADSLAAGQRASRGVGRPTTYSQPVGGRDSRSSTAVPRILTQGRLQL